MKIISVMAGNLIISSIIMKNLVIVNDGLKMLLLLPFILHNNRFYSKLDVHPDDIVPNQVFILTGLGIWTPSS